jgi:DNA-binding NarL/FixJ family response regulator
MAEGRSNGAIAEALFMSPKTVEANVPQIFRKLGLQQSRGDHRRVLAVLRYLRPNSDGLTREHRARADPPAPTGRSANAAHHHKMTSRVAS